MRNSQAKLPPLLFRSSKEFYLRILEAYFSRIRLIGGEVNSATTLKTKLLQNDPKIRLCFTTFSFVTENAGKRIFED